MNNETWRKSIKERRLTYGLTQSKLAQRSGISRDYYNKIENGKLIPSNERKQFIEQALERFNPESPLDMLIDYVRLRFPTTDVQEVIQNVLRLKMKYFLHQDFGYYGYSEHFVLGDIMVLVSHDEDKGVLLELKGRGSRQFEGYLEAQGRDWYEFFMDCLIQKAVIKRLDLAINDKVGLLNIPTLTKKCANEECISVFRSFKSYRSGELTKRNEKIGMGHTLYIGSLRSDIYMCLYQKNYEEYAKKNIPLSDTETKNRFEIRLKNERALYALKDLLKHEDPERTAFKIINRYLRFCDKEKGKPRSEWKLNEDWKLFIGENRKAMRLTTKPEPYTFDRTLRWLAHQVAPSLKIATKLDELHNTSHIQDMISKAKLKDKHITLLKQQSVSIEDIVL